MTRALIIVDQGKVGTRKQAEALCRGLDIPFDVVEVDTAWCAFVSPFGKMQKVLYAKQQGGAPYTLVFSAGRKSAPWALRMKWGYPYLTYVHIMNPGWGLHRFFDVVLIPEHDGLKGPNIIQTCGALVCPEDPSPDMIKTFTPLIKKHKKTFVLIIGGPTKAYTFTQSGVEVFIQNVDKVLDADPMNVLITFSRRTDPDTQRQIAKWAHARGAFVWDGQGLNPYAFFLKKADYFLVTQDSISMICEACYTGKPVYVARLQGSHARFDRFFADLLAHQRIRWFEGQCEPGSYEALREILRVRDVLKEKILGK